MRRLGTIAFLFFFSTTLNAQCWQAVSAGINHTIAIKPDGTLWAWGFNGAGQLGDGTTIEKSVPVKIGNDSNWKTISAGGNSSVAIKTNGTLWGWGDNFWGQLGNGINGDNRFAPVRIGTDSNWKQVSEGSTFTLAIKNDGSLWGWGNNLWGQLGNQTIVTFVPTRVGNTSDWKTVSAGENHTIAIKLDGTLWAWGLNSKGQLGDGTLINKATPVKIGSESNWKSIAIGDSFSVAIKTDGTLWAWGTNDLGQVGNGTFAASSIPTQVGAGNTWESVSVGRYSSFAIKTDGTLWTWGWKIGSVFFDIDNSHNSPTQVGVDSDWQSSASGQKHTFAFKTNGTLWAWGDDAWGKLGIDSNLDTTKPQTLATSSPFGEATQVFCGSAATIASLVAAGTSIKWYTTEAGGTPLLTNTQLISGGSYYASQTKNSCESSARFKVTVTLNTSPAPPPSGASTQVHCSQSTITNLLANGTNIKWYVTATGGTALGNNTVLVNGARYYASQTINACESSSRLEVLVTINTTPAPTGNTIQSFCNNATILNLALTGTGIQWYSTPTGGVALQPNTTLTHATLYYATQTLNSCESSRLTVYVSINKTPAPTGQPVQAFCNSGTIGNLVAAGANVKWYSNEVGGLPLVASTPLIDGGDYYGTQVLNSCESANRLKVTASINTTPTPPPTGVAAQTVCGSVLSSLNVSGNDIKWYSVASGGTPLPSSTVLANGSRYFASQTLNVCESSTRLEVSVLLNSVPMPLRVGGYSWRAFSAGDNHTLAIMNDGTLWSWGDNRYGQLGDGTSTNQNEPTLIGNETGWKSVFAGNSTSMALKEDGTIWVWGYDNSSSPIQIGSDNDWKVLSTSGSHTLAIKDNGTLWAWGWNYYGQLGDGTRVNKNRPTQIGTDNDWNAVSANGVQSVAIKNDKTLWTWGKIGVGTHDGITIPTELDFYSGWESVSAGTKHLLAIRSDGTLWAWGSNEYGQLGNAKFSSNESSPNKISSDGDWIKVSGGFHHSTAMKKDGSIWAWGQNSYGQSGNGTLYGSNEPKLVGNSTDWQSISASTGGYHTIASKKDGSLWAWGYNWKGELGDGTNQQKNFPKKIEAPQQRFCLGAKVENLQATGTDVKWYDTPFGGASLQLTSPLIDGNFYYASQTTGALESCSRLKVKILLGETPEPIGPNNQTLCSGSLISNLNVIGTNVKWYDANSGGFAISSTADLVNGKDYFASQTIDLCESDKRLKVTASLNGNSTAPPVGIALQSFCFGATVSKLVANGEKINWYDKPSAGKALSSNETLIDGQAYYGTQTVNSCESIVRLKVNVTIAPSEIPPPIEGEGVKWSSVSTMYNTNLALRSDGTLFGWGLNDYGQLGIGLSYPYHIFDSPVPLESAIPWVSFASGYYHSVAIKADGSLWAWGYNSDIQPYFQPGLLGDGKKVSKSLPIQIGTDKDWRFVSVCSDFSAAIKNDGTLWSWGRNINGQLGDGTNTNRNVPIQVGKDTDWVSVSLGLHHTLALKVDGSLWAWGQNVVGELGDGTVVDKNTPKKIGTSSWRFIAAGAYRSFAIRTDGTLWSWGNNRGGILGNGTYGDRAIPTQVGNDADWKSIALGIKDGHVFALKADGTLWGWGGNVYGQLGNGVFSGIPLIVPNKIGNDSDWESVSVGIYHTIGTKKNGTLWQWGNFTDRFFTNKSFNTPQLVQSNTARTIQAFCYGATVGSLKVIGTDVRWFDTETDGVALSNATLLTNGGHYYAEQSNGTCYSNSRLEVIAYIISSQPPTGSTTQVFCSAATVSNLTLVGSGIKWYATLSGGTPLATSALLTNGTRYYASQTVNGCESQTRLEVLVNVNNTPPPTGASTQTICSPATISNLTATGTAVKWYSSATGGTELTATSQLVNGTRYYASQTVNACESQTRLEVLVTLNDTTLPSGSTSQTFCAGATVANLLATGTNIKWYASPTAIASLASTATLTNGTRYYATQTLNNCESQTRLEVLVTLNSSLPPTGASSQTFCSAATVANLVASGNNIKWYAAATGGTTLASTIALANGLRYYASQTLNSCESVARLEVLANVTTASAPVGASTQTFCQGATIGNLVATGNAIKWYSSSTSGTPLPSSTPLVNNIQYFASQTVVDCESSTRLSITTIINPIPPAPSGASSQAVETGKTITSLVAVGTSIKWYATEMDAINRRNTLPLSTQVLSGASYYATQTVLGCESVSFLKVTASLITGIEINDPLLEFYPNPVTDILSVTYHAGIDEVTVANLIGQIVVSKKVNGKETSVDFSDLGSGIYLIRLHSRDNLVHFKIMKR
jgi:alpha-tubulin suppressor-like RCC1 family protein